MLSANINAQTILNASSKEVSWLFKQTVGSNFYFWSTKNYTYNTENYLARVIPDSFSGIKLNSSLSNNRIMIPSLVTFDISDINNEYTVDDFINEELLIKLVIKSLTDEQEVGTWRFSVTQAKRKNGRISFVCEDFFSRYLKGTYPKTELISSLSLSDDVLPNDNLCIPVIFGTAYMPTRSLFISDKRYYILGPSGPTYLISEFRTPLEWDSISKWDNTYTYTQTVKTLNGNNYVVVSPIIVDSDNDGIPDSTGLFFKNNSFLDAQIKVSRSDTVTMTSFADVIEYVLEDMGIPSDYIDTDDSDSSFNLAKDIYSDWGLICNGGFFYKKDRIKVLSELLIQCNSILRITDKIELHVFSKTSVKTLTSSSIRSKGEGQDTTFSYRENEEEYYDSGYVAFSESDTPQLLMKQVLVSINGLSNNKSNEILEVSFVNNSENIQKIGILDLQKKYGIQEILSFEGRDDLLVLQPDDVITINDSKYGGNYNVVINQVNIKPDLTVALQVHKYNHSLSNWEDLSPNEIILSSDNTLSYYKPVISGPDDATGQNILRSRVRVGSTILLDGETGTIVVGENVNSITFAGNETGIFIGGTGYFRAGGSLYGMTFNPSTGILQADKVKVGSGTNYIDIDGGNTRIQSSNYISGAMGAGFSLTPELFEVGNIAARGIIRTSVFQYDSISAHGGSRVLAHGADVLAADMTALDSSTLTIAGNETWAVNDRLRIKEGTDDEWFVITSIASAPTYAVTRDMDAQYTSNNNPVWKKGAAVVNYGQSGDGGIYETASETNAPYLSVFTHAGSPWDTISSHIRMGNLNGYAGYTSDVYGLAAYIDANNYIKIDPTNGIDMSGKITLKSGSGVDWSYVSGTGKPSDYADVTNYTDTRIANALSENDVTTIRQPGGAAYSSPGNPDIGAIVITLPQSWTSTMMRFAIDVFLYQTTGNLSFTAMVGGLNQIATTQWRNTFAQIIGSTTADNRVRFGHNGTKCCVVIGETTSRWHYPNINIRDFQASHSNFTVANWDDGWAISITKDLTGYTFSADIADALLDAKAIKNQGDLATADTVNWGTQVDGRPANLAALTGTENINNASITINANGTLTGAGSGQVTATGIGAETPTGAQSKADAALTAAQNYADTYFVLQSTHTDDLAALQSQIDGNITTWFYAYAPTTSNEPASSWTTDALKNQHLGDLFYDTVTGYAYRYLLSGTYQWQKLSDSDIAAALSAASAAQDTADSKRRVFVATPTTPYDVGDLWDASGTVKRCSTERLSGAYVAGDWTTIANYTTNTNQLTDGAGLGTTATWAGVSGTGKPEDYADVTPPLPSDENLIAYWSFDDGSGAVAVDNSGHALNGAITGATWAAGKSGGCLNFVPANMPGVNMGSPVALNVYNSPFTISAWFYDRTQDGKLALGNYGGNYIGFLISYGWGFTVGEGSASNKNIPECSPDLNQWTHLVGVFDGTYIRAYKNGVQVGSQVACTPATWAGQNFMIGRYNWIDGYYGDGLIDEVRFYNTALTASEIKALYLNPSGNKSQTINVDSLTPGTYGKVLSTDISAGHIVLSSCSGTVDWRSQIGGTGKPSDYADVTKENPFVPKYTSEFRGVSDGWTVNNATIINNVDSITIISSGDAQLVKSVSINGSLYNKIRVRIKRTAGSAWQGTLYYSTSGHGPSESYKKTISWPSISNGVYTILEWDMNNLTSGGTDWINNTITALRFDFADDALSNYEVDWIAIGKDGVDPFTEQDLDNLANGLTYGKVLSTIIDAGYITLLRASATANQRITITATGVEQYTNNVKMIELASGSLYLGDQSNEHIKLSSGGLDVYDGATKLANFSSTVTVGQVASGQNNIYIDSGAIQLRNNTTPIISITSGGIPTISMPGSDSTPGKILFKGDDYDTEIYAMKNGIFHYKTSSGSTYYTDVYQYASSSIAQMTFTSRNGSYYSGFSIIADNAGLRVIRPYADITVDFGDDTAKWNNIRCRHLYIDADGTPAYGGDLTAEGYVTFPEVYNYNFSTGRDLYVSASGKIGYLSSSVQYKNLKTKITDVSWMKNIEVWYYEHKKEKGITLAGFTAEQLYSVQPSNLFNLVSLDEKGDPATVNYSQMVPHLTAGWQDHESRIEILEKENVQLKKQLGILE